MYQLSDKEIEVIEGEGWKVGEIEEQDGCSLLEIENWSPAGEDLPETIWIREGETLAQAAWKWANSFDPDDHVELWAESRGKRGVPETIRELVDDAEAIRGMFIDLARALELSEKEAKEDGRLKEYRIPLLWQMYGHVWVEAHSEKEAIEKALHSPDIPLPDGVYVYDSLELDEDIDIEVSCILLEGEDEKE